MQQTAAANRSTLISCMVWGVPVRVLLGISALAAALSPGFAADLPVKAPAVPVPAVYSWTGLYAGGHIGRAASQDWTSTFTPLPSPAAFGALGNNFSQDGRGT